MSEGCIMVKRKGYMKEVDSFEILPDELLVFILSLLSLKEGVATSILSSRWRYLWRFVSKLDFDGTSLMLKVVFEDRRFVLDEAKSHRVEWIGERRLSVDEARRRYVVWVDDIIGLKCGDIEEFRIFFDLTNSYKRWIDGWLRFALSRKVQRLELNLTPEASQRNIYFDCYTFDLHDILCLNRASVGYEAMRQVKYLKKIVLHNVNVNGEALEFFLCNSPMLQHLSVCRSMRLSTLRIVGPFLSLKHLEIDTCNGLDSVEIRDVNLVYLKYSSMLATNFVVENVPLLVEMYIGATRKHIEEILFQFANYLPQLEILTMEFFSASFWKITQDLCSTVKLINLKQLIVRTWIDYDDSLIPLTNAIHASPYLRRFVLQATSCDRPRFIEREATKIVRSYPRLKEIEFVGYQGLIGEVELLRHFLDNGVTLQKIVIDTSPPKRNYWQLERDPNVSRIRYEVEKRAKLRAMKLLKGNLPSTINLMIL